MNIKIPKTIDGLKLKHVEAFELLRDTEYIPVKDKIKVISIITGYSVEKLSQYEWGNLKKVFNKIVECLGTYKENELPLSIEFNGSEYELVQKLDKLPASWFIDADTVELEKHPEVLASLCYIEKGMEYCEKDKHKNIKNPIKPRAEVFKEHLPLSTFLDLSAFFLQKHKQYKTSLVMINQAREKLREKKEKRLSGKK